MFILGVYHYHDAGAALYDDYRLIAAVAQERVTRIKGDGCRFPTEAIAECLAQAGLRADQIDVVALPRGNYPAHYFTARSRWRSLGRDKTADDRELLSVMRRQWIRDPEKALDARRYLADHGLKPHIVSGYNHHLAHALGALFHTDFSDALIYTSDGSADRICYSARRLTGGKLVDLFGGEVASFGQSRVVAESWPGCSAGKSSPRRRQEKRR